MADFIITVVFVLLAIYCIKSLFSPRRNPSNMPLIINRRGGRRNIPQGRGPQVLPLAPPEEQSEKPPIFSSGGGDHDDQGGTDFDASPQDVLAVKNLLMRAGKLPVELVNLIVEHAEYWACSSTTVDYSDLPLGHLLIRGSSRDQDQFLVRTEPLAMTSWSPSDDDAWRQPSTPISHRTEYPPESLQKFADEPKPTLVHPCRKIVFHIHSNDQGWSSNRQDHGTYRNSATWFDVGLERFDADAEGPGEDGEKALLMPSSDVTVSALRPLWPLTDENQDGERVYIHELHAAPEHKIQCNAVAIRQSRHHHIEWKWTDDVDPESDEADALDDVGRGRATMNGEFVRNLKLGDVVTVWGRARYGSWQNHVHKIEIKVYWTV